MKIYCLTATLLLALSVLGGCGLKPGTPPVPGLQGFTVRELHTDGYRLVGLEAFDVHLRVPSAPNRSIQAYGIKTEFERTIRPIPSLPMPVADGLIFLQSVALAVGEYPFELWLVDDQGVESNHLNGRVFIQ